MVQSLEEGARPQDILSPTAFARAPGFYGTATNENAITLGADLESGRPGDRIYGHE